MYKIFYHELVWKDDFRKLSLSEKKKITKAIDKKLRENPKSFGKALGADLKGYYRLRVGFYRVVYRVEDQKVVVLIIKIGLRKDLKVYVEAAIRLKLLQ